MSEGVVAGHATGTLTLVWLKIWSDVTKPDNILRQ